MICFVCQQVLTDDDEKELFGLDGDFIHKKCRSKLNCAIDFVNNMSDEEFELWVLNYAKGGR